jgi:hypothetical protein
VNRRRRRVLLVLGVLAFTAYFAFSTFVFNPLEGSFGSVEIVVPRTVDFFVRKTDLERGVPRFPRPVFYESLAASESWEAFLRSDLFAGIDAKWRIREGLQDLEREIAEVPFEPIRDLLGREVVVAGNFAGPDLSRAAVALYARVSWRVKLALALVRFAAVRSRIAPDLRVREEGGMLIFEGAVAGRDLFVRRLKDLLVVSFDAGLVRAVKELRGAEGQGSLGLSSKYHDAVEARRAEFLGDANEAEIYLDAAALAQARGKPFAWPDPSSTDLAARIASRFFSLDAVLALGGLLRFGGGLEADFRLELNTDLLGPLPKKLYAAPSGDLNDEVMRWVATMAPREVFLLGYARADVGDLARAALDALTPEARRLVDDAFRGTGQYADASLFVEAFAPAVENRLGIILRRNYPRSPEDPPNDGSPAPCFALIFQIRGADGAKRIEQIREFFITHGVRFGITQPWEIPITGDYRAIEYWCPAVRGTGEIAAVTTGNTLVVGNSWKFLSEMIAVFFATTPGRRLSEDESFRAMVEDLPEATKAFAYLHFDRFAQVMRDHVPRLVAADLDAEVEEAYVRERPKVRERVIREQFPTWAGRSLPAEVSEQIERAVDDAMESVRLEIYSRGEAAARQKLLDRIAILGALPEARIHVTTDARRIEARAKVRVEFR